MILRDKRGIMVDRDAAFRIANDMRKLGRRPSVRKVRASLTAAGLPGGSPRRMVEILDEWRSEHGLSEFEADIGMPPNVQARIDAVTASLWEAARTRADAAWRTERLRLDGKLDEAKRSLADMETRLADAEKRLRTAVSEIEAQTKRADKAEADQTRRAKEYWNRVLRAAGAVLEREKRPMIPSEILGLLSDDLHREAIYHAEGLDLGTLSEKLKVRGKHSRYVEALADGSGRWRHRSVERPKPVPSD